MELKTIDDLKFIINKYTNEEKELLIEEEKLLNELDYTFLLSTKRKRIRNLAYEKRNEINKTKYIKERYFNMFSELTTFDSNLLYPFLIEYLSNIENEKYILITGIKENIYPLSNIANYFDLNIFDIHFDIITTFENKKRLDKFGNFENDDIYDQLYLLKDNKYICFDHNDKQTLLNGPELTIDLLNFPYIKDVAYSLIEKKLEDPNISDSIRLDSILHKEKKLIR